MKTNYLRKAAALRRQVMLFTVKDFVKELSWKLLPIQVVPRLRTSDLRTSRTYERTP